jgi:hypothetical protein
MHIQLMIQNRVNTPKAISRTLVVVRIFIVDPPRFWLKTRCISAPPRRW